ncbi:MAG: allantoinase AllB [Geodermatophilaceae bacterium]|nr:allantoinase AllB [Geodermatophilaceae bacterium]
MVIRARRVVFPTGVDAAALCIHSGRLTAIGPLDAALSADVTVEYGDDVVLLPGLVDSHVHVNEPGRTDWEGFASATRAAAAGGVTALIDMPLNSIPPTVDVAALEVKRRAAATQSTVDVGFWGGAVPGNSASLAPLHEAGVFGFKCFLLDSGVPEFPPLSAVELEVDLRILAGFDGLMLVHAEDPAVIGAAQAAGGPAYRDFLASRPARAEDTAIATAIDAARRSGAQVHILHLSSASALPLIAAARADGVRLTVETCPHYLTLAAGGIPDGATAYKCCPPIRDEANRDLLWQALADGLIDCVVSDHSPSTADLKNTGDFGTAWGGISSLQIGLPAVWTEARRRGHRLAEVVSWMAAGPARVAGVAGKGAIEVGNDADFVVFAPDEEFVVDPGALHHKNPVSPYAGMGLTGVVRETWLRGVPVGDRPHGRLLRRD